jgi:hypothetical protein
MAGRITAGNSFGQCAFVDTTTNPMPAKAQDPEALVVNPIGSEDAAAPAADESDT